MSQQGQRDYFLKPSEPSDWTQELTPSFTHDDAKLRLMLTLHSYVPSNHAAAEKEEEKEQTLWTQIGVGSCGAIFAPRGRSEVVKVAKKDDNALWNDFVMHRKILRSVIKYPGLRVKFPRCLGFTPKEDNFFADRPSLQQLASATCPVPADVLVSERILPLPQPARAHLIEKFCPPELKGIAHANINQHCLVRPYLGARNRTLNRWVFSLYNFKFYIDMMESLQLEVKTLACAMGEALAVVHWDARTDGRDIEFALGSTRTMNTLLLDVPLDIREKKLVGPLSCNLDDLYWRQTQLYCLDFHQVREITLDEKGVDMMVDAFRANAPYFPRPLQQTPTEREAWTAFGYTYLTMAGKVLEHEDENIRGLPAMFVRKIVNAEWAKQINRAQYNGL